MTSRENENQVSAAAEPPVVSRTVRSGHRFALVYDLAERLIAGGTARVVGGARLAERERAHTTAVKRAVAQSGVLVTMANGYVVFYAAPSREFAEELLSDAAAVLDTSASGATEKSL